MEGKEGYLTVGELAKKMNVSVRTVQYYDQIGLLSPSGFSEGGRRLYSMKDYIILYQIISLKEFGFSLKEIKERLIPADSIEEIEKYLISQEKNIRNEINILEKKHELISKFRKEMKKIDQFDWALFIEILSLLRNNDENYWVVKHFDKDVFDRLKKQYKKEESKRFIEKMEGLCDRAWALQSKGASPDSEETLELAETWWSEIMDFTGGDKKMIQQMVNIASDEEPGNSVFMKKFKKVEGYINDAMMAYFEKNTMENFNEMGDDHND